jgi:hypothetical protein
LFPFIVSLVLLGIQVSYFLVITVGVLAICFPIAIKLNRRAGLAYYLASLKADRRLKLTNELLQGMFCTIIWVLLSFLNNKSLLVERSDLILFCSGIRIVKYYAWENAFKNNVENQRDLELVDVHQLSLERGITGLMMQNIGSLAQGLTLVHQ